VGGVWHEEREGIMARRKAVFVPGNYYHVYNRGINRELIFRSDENYVFLLRRFKEFAALYEISTIANCLMPNHFHFLLKQNENGSISQLMQAVFNSYTKAFNKAYQRSGTLFEGRFKAIHIQRDSYLLHLCRYIHRNPMEAGLAAHPAQWPYSNYLEWMGKRDGTLVDLEFSRGFFPNPGDYEEFTLSYIPPEKVPEELRCITFA